MKKRGSTTGIAFLILLIILLGASIYALYLNIPSDPVEFEFANTPESQEQIEYGKSKQFYENMRFPDRFISYKIEDDCDEIKSAQVEEAFTLIESQTILEFFPSEDGQIEITCSKFPPEAESEDYFVAGEGGPTEVINTSLYAVVFKGKLSLFRDEKCQESKIALHEIFHVLGFDHNNNPRSILFPTLSCDQTIDQELIEDINILYSVQGSADLKVEKVTATKSGRFLDFEIEVINQGLRDASEVKLSVFHEDKKIEFEGGKDYLDLEEIAVGTKKVLSVTNAKIARSSKRITFVVDEDQKIDEIFEENNQIDLVLVNN